METSWLFYCSPDGLVFGNDTIDIACGVGAGQAAGWDFASKVRLDETALLGGKETAACLLSTPSTRGGIAVQGVLKPNIHNISRKAYLFPRLQPKCSRKHLGCSVYSETNLSLISERKKKNPRKHLGCSVYSETNLSPIPERKKNTHTKSRV